MSEPVGVVLAGGAGTRMGAPKATVLLAGRPLLSYPLTALREVVSDVAVVCREDTELPPLPDGVAIWREVGGERRHPLLGVGEALRRAGGRAVIVVAGDMPLVTPAALRALLAAEPDDRAAVARAGGRLEPLLARYPAAALAALDGRDDNASATAVVAGLAPVVVEVDRDAAMNANAPTDLARAKALLARAGVGHGGGGMT